MSSAAVREPTASYTVEDVAALVGTSVRTIRWYQSEGLLPPPRRDGRTAIYTADHVDRLEAIRDLRAHGLSLTAIRRLLEHAPDGAAGTALAFVQAAVAYAGDRERAEIVDAEVGAARLGVRPTRDTVATLVSLGVIEELPDARWRIVAPAAFSAGEELHNLGVPAEQRLAVTRELREHADAMAGAVTELFVEHVLRPSHESGAPDWAALTRLIARLRPLATTTVATFFDEALVRAAEQAAETELEGTPHPR